MIRSSRSVCLACVFLVTILISSTTEAGPKSSKKLETTHVTLYDCGLAQFERRAEIRGAEKLEMAVTLAHLDDMLASLVLATDGSVRVKGVNYKSVQNLGQAVAASGLAHAMSKDEEEQLSMPETLSGYIEALVGTSVTVKKKSGKRMEGTVLDCVDQDGNGVPIKKDPANEELDISQDKILVLVNPKGTMSWIPLDEIDQISPKSEREAAAIYNFSSQLGNAGGFGETSITLETTPESKGTLAAGYIRQAPIWRMTYKLTAHLDHVILEAWAVVHNDTTEDWNNVEMTLLSGLPKSYVLSLASPRYGEREGRQLEGEGYMMPQLGAETPDSLLYDLELFRIGTSYGYGGMGMSGYGVGGGGSGSGTIGAASYGTVGYGSGDRASSLLQIGDPAAEEQMEAAVEAEISRYMAMNKVTIPAGTSSMVPVIRKRLDGRAFTMISSGAEPSTCFEVENGTGLVIQGGLGSFYINGRFRGETEIYRTEPGEKRIWCFGGDPDVRFTYTNDIATTHKSLEWLNDNLWMHSLRRTDTTYTLENLAGQPRKIAIKINHISNGRVVSPENVSEGEHDNQKLYVFDLKERSKENKTIEIEEAIMSTIPIDIQNLESTLEHKTIPNDQLSIIEEVRELLLEAKALKQRVEETAKQIDEVKVIVARHQETLKAVPNVRGHSRMVKKILEKVLSAEAKLQTLGKKQKTIEEKVTLATDHANYRVKALER